MTLTADEPLVPNQHSEKIFVKDESKLKEAEVLLVSLEDYILRRFSPKPDGFVSKGVFLLKLDELTSKVESLESSAKDADFLWICEEITLLMNLCRNMETAIRCKADGAPAAEAVGACNDTDQLLDCLQIELRRREQESVVLHPLIKRLTKVKAHYLAELTSDWAQQVRWQSSDYPETHRLILSLDAGRTFELLSALRSSSHLTNELISKFIEVFVRPVVDDRCVLTVKERTGALELEAIIDMAEDRNADSKVCQNLQVIYGFINRTLLSLFGLQEDSRELGALFNLLADRAREESSQALYDLISNLQNELPQTAMLLKSYAADSDASKEALQIVSEMEEMMSTSLEPTEEVEIEGLPKNLARQYVVSSWIPSLADSILRLKQESILLPVFSCLFRHFSSLVTEALCSSFKCAVFLNNCIYLANRCSLHTSVASTSIVMLKHKGTSVFLKFINENKMSDISMSMPVSSALKIFLAYINSLADMESSWKRILPFENYSKATALLFNSFSNVLETYIFQQKFLTDFEVSHLKSLLLRSVSLAEAWQRANEQKLHVSNLRLDTLLKLLQMNPDEIYLAWTSSLKNLSSIFTAQQVSSLAKARFTLEEYDKLNSVLL